MNRGWLSAALAALVLQPCCVLAQVAFEAYPARPVRVVIGLAPGGGPDIQARLLFAQKLSGNFGRLFVVENRTGAGGTVAYAHIANAAPDGYTLIGWRRAGGQRAGAFRAAPRH